MALDLTHPTAASGPSRHFAAPQQQRRFWGAKRTPSLRPIPVERDPDHDQRADCDHHGADKRQLFQHSDNGRPPDKSSLQTREAPACHTHSDNSVWPPAAACLNSKINAKRSAIANSGVTLDEGEETHSPAAFAICFDKNPRRAGWGWRAWSPSIASAPTGRPVRPLDQGQEPAALGLQPRRRSVLVTAKR
jgi:hypothetical protein